MDETTTKTAQEVAAAAAQAGWFNLAHVLGVIMYAGGLLCAAKMMGHLVKLEPPVRAGGAVAARKMYYGVAFPGLLLALGTGVYTIIMDPSGKQYLTQGYFHIKLLAVLLVIAVDHMLVMRPLKALTREDTNTEGQEGLYKAGYWMVTLLILVVLLALYVVKK